MIRASELRIGNYLNQKNNADNKLELKAVDVIDLHMIIAHDVGNTDYFQPIPINEEWIIKLGLYYIGNKRWRFNNYVIEYWCDMYVIKYISMKNEFIQIGIEIKYVHQFQNVCFTLTGEELTYKLGHNLRIFNNGSEVDNPIMVSISLPKNQPFPTTGPEYTMTFTTYDPKDVK